MSSEKTPHHRFLTIEQVAEELNVGLPQVRSLLKSGELRGFQLGGRRLWRIGVGDFEKYIIDAYEQTAMRIASGEADAKSSAAGEAEHER
jgi:prophage regulatory protein